MQRSHNYRIDDIFLHNFPVKELAKNNKEPSLAQCGIYVNIPRTGNVTDIVFQLPRDKT